MEKTFEKMKEQKQEIYDLLAKQNIPVFEDEIAQDEEIDFNENGYHFFVLQMGEIEPTNQDRILSQVIDVYYYSQYLDDLDEKVVNLIADLRNIYGITFQRTNKLRVQLKDTDQYVDQVMISLRRKIPIGC
ncbi:hypothetical protein LC087_19445 (plasmid) [Bacillus carboniphilus]|uniref:Immunity protein 63 domain-containing protein n=1 Tax=Bacillus carboniphilus TaxID=86663 RepID=A0ABY9K1J6_9BACI|nr:hypothetical protein [Bacillus carboniphilus]WLR44478.1 hypothetical protein LC087_19445 [Bacillus carboniphilus]